MKTVGSYWPYATTLFDYIHRAMPADKPQSLAPDEVYALCAYLLYLNGIVPEDAVMDAQTLPQVVMPNHAGFTSPDPRPDVFNTAPRHPPKRPRAPCTKRVMPAKGISSYGHGWTREPRDASPARNDGAVRQRAVRRAAATQGLLEGLWASWRSRIGGVETSLARGPTFAKRVFPTSSTTK